MGLPAVVLGQGAAGPAVSGAKAPGQVPGQAGELTDAQKEAQKEAEKYAKAVEGLTRTSGDMTLYRRKKDVLIELDESDLGRLVCFQATVSVGVGADGLQAGDPLNFETVELYRFEKAGDDDVRLVKPQLGRRWSFDDPLAVASARSFPEAILANYKIEARDPIRKKLLVNITRMFDGTLVGLPATISSTIGPGYTADAANSDLEMVKAFPENAVVRARLHFRKSQGGGEDGFAAALRLLLGISGPPLADARSLPLVISHNMWFRRDRGYVPRLADPRVGFFTVDFFDVAKMNQLNRTTRFIQRFHLEKKDPLAAMSEPVKPIVWYLDHSIPDYYRPAVRDGILFWNKAFERLGYRNAIVVLDAPQDPDWDHADGRFNVVRWTMTEDSAYGVALFRVDPLTGEILNASVTIDANYPASAFTEFAEDVSGVGGAQGLSGATISGVERDAWIDPEGHARDLRRLVEEPMARHGWRRSGCDHARGICAERGYGLAVMEASGAKVDRDKFVHGMVADLVAHEVGHCLGLRHNFAASTQNTLAQLADDSWVASRGVAASVMDYTPLNVAAVLAGTKSFYNPTVGVYDLWAIEYGYAEVPGETPEAERAGLNAIASRSGLPGLMYLTDEDADGVNPLAVRWDLGQDVIGYLRLREQSDLLLRRYALTRAVQNGEPYTRRNALLLRTLRSGFRNALVAARQVGGVEFRRHFKGDVGERPTLRPVAVSQQRAAMRFILDVAFRGEMADLPQEVLFGMSGAPDANGANYIAPLRQFLGMNQRLVLATLTSQAKLDAISENAFKTREGGQRYTVAEHYNALFAEVFKEIGTDAEISPLRRDLQRFFLGALIGQSVASGGTVNEDARVVASQGVRRIGARVKSALGRPGLSDEMTRLHLQDMDGQIDRFLNRVATAAVN